MGAFSAPMAAAARGGVERIALVAPMIPVPGETAGAFWEASGQDAAQRAFAVEEGRDPDAPFDLHEMFLHDVPAAVAALAARGGRLRVTRARPSRTRGRSTPGPTSRRP